MLEISTRMKLWRKKQADVQSLRFNTRARTPQSSFKLGHCNTVYLTRHFVAYSMPIFRHIFHRLITIILFAFFLGLVTLLQKHKKHQGLVNRYGARVSCLKRYINESHRRSPTR
jgi:hypothetical protein